MSQEIWSHAKVQGSIAAEQKNTLIRLVWDLKKKYYDMICVKLVLDFNMPATDSASDVTITLFYASLENHALWRHSVGLVCFC